MCLFVGLIVDISDEVRRNGPDSLLTENHLERWQRYHSPLPEKFILLIRFGWSQYYGVHKLYFGTNPKEIHHPGNSLVFYHQLSSTFSVF